MVLFLLISVIFSTALCTVAFLLISAGDIKTFRKLYGKKRTTKLSNLPLVTSHGDIVNSLEDLDVQLEVLKSQLAEKQNLLQESKTKVASAAQNLQKLHYTSCEATRNYVKLKAEITKSDLDCKELQRQIEEYRNTQNKLREEVNANIQHYHYLMNDAGGSQPDFEFLPQLPIRSET